jgi:hypothetical protein
MYPKMSSSLATQPKCELTSQKSGRRSTLLTKVHRQPLLFDLKQPQNIF